VAAVEGLGVGAIQATHLTGEIGLRGLQQQVVVVAHQAVGGAAPALLLHLLSEPLEEVLTVARVEKDGLSSVATGRDVVERAGELETQGPSHARQYGRRQTADQSSMADGPVLVARRRWNLKKRPRWPAGAARN